MWSFVHVYAYACIVLCVWVVARMTGQPSDDWFTDVHFPSGLQGELDLRRWGLMGEFLAV